MKSKITGSFERVRVYSANGWKRYAIVPERGNYVLMEEVATFGTLKGALELLRDKYRADWCKE